MATTKIPTDKKAGRDEWQALLITLVDTSVRIITPTVGLAVIGLVVDLKYHTGPWLTLVATAVGFVIAARLIALQIKGMK